jgi:hypothetical protein
MSASKSSLLSGGHYQSFFQSHAMSQPRVDAGSYWQTSSFPWVRQLAAEAAEDLKPVSLAPRLENQSPFQYWLYNPLPPNGRRIVVIDRNGADYLTSAIAREEYNASASNDAVKTRVAVLAAVVSSAMFGQHLEQTMSDNGPESE